MPALYPLAALNTALVVVNAAFFYANLLRPGHELMSAVQVLDIALGLGVSLLVVLNSRGGKY